MNLDKARSLLAKLPVKHRDRNVSVPFILNPNQVKAFDLVKKQYSESKWIRAIVLKSRRVGMSSFFDGLLTIHGVARPQAHARIVAHLKQTSETGLFRVPRDLGLGLNQHAECCDVRARSIIFYHQAGDSLLDLATAGTGAGGRGETLTALHLSEAASFPGDDSFLSLLPAVSKGPDTIIAIESTAYGRTGIGQSFYEFWNSACAGNNGYIPIFLSWLDDPACRRSADEAEDAPASDLERELMKKPFGASREQIAWMRLTMASECKNEEPKWLQEYPHTPEVAFIATGDPAFPREEIAYAVSTKKPPLMRGRMKRKGSDKTKWFEKSSRGELYIWEYPKSKCWYYIGGDAAAGYETGDFSALVGWNGTTGRQAFRWAAHAHPEDMADLADMLGRWYNNAMVNIELTGNLGRWAQKKLRDEYFYPNLYVWKGKDDKRSGKDHGKSHGWETTSYSKGLMFDAFRECLRAGLKGHVGGIEIYDEELVRQMDIATFTEGLRWEVSKGHDDILLASMLAIVTRAQYPPPNILSFIGNVMDTKEEKHASAVAALKAKPDIQEALRNDLRYIFRGADRKNKNILGFI